MKYSKVILQSFLFLFVAASCFAQSKINPNDIKDKMQWFADAKLVIFIHAGIYSVDVLTNPGVFTIKRSAMRII